MLEVKDRSYLSSSRQVSTTSSFRPIPIGRIRRRCRRATKLRFVAPACVAYLPKTTSAGRCTCMRSFAIWRGWSLYASMRALSIFPVWADHHDGGCGDLALNRRKVPEAIAPRDGNPKSVDPLRNGPTRLVAGKPANFGVKLAAGWCPARQPSCLQNSRASRRHGGCSSRLGSTNVIRGSRRAASFLAREARRSLHQGR